MKLSLDIENKILIPFTLLLIVPMVLVGAFSYWSNYNNLVSDDIAYQKVQLKHLMIHINEFNKEVESSALSMKEAEESAMAIIDETDYKNITVYVKGKLKIEKGLSAGTNLYERTADYKKGREEDRKNLYLYDSYGPWNWKVVMLVDKSLFRDELVNLQKNTLLLIIIFLILSMQAIIIIAHNISKPIRRFADVCRKIENENIETGQITEKISISRKDEIGVLSSAFDNMIDQINSSTKKIIEMTQFNENILQSIRIGIFTVDQNGELVSMNTEFQNILKKYNDENIFDILMKEINDTMKSGISGQKSLSFSSSVFDMAYLDVSTSLLKKNDGDSYGAICTVNDATERKKMENNIIRADRLSSVGEFAAGLAHEIRNPLAGLKTGIQVVDNRVLKEQDTSTSQLLKDLIYEIDRINILVTELLDFSRPQTAVKEKISINEIARKSLDMVQDSVKQKKIRTSITSTGAREYYAHVDKRQIEQVFLNLITNAIDAVPEKGRVNIKIYELEDESGSFIFTVFEDDGPGIDHELQQKIFNPFFTTKAKGTGLGLPVAVKLAEQNNGLITIESLKDDMNHLGTIICVKLPKYEE